MPAWWLSVGAAWDTLLAAETRLVAFAWLLLKDLPPVTGLQDEEVLRAPIRRALSEWPLGSARLF